MLDRIYSRLSLAYGGRVLRLNSVPRVTMWKRGGARHFVEDIATEWGKHFSAVAGDCCLFLGPNRGGRLVCPDDQKWRLSFFFFFVSLSQGKKNHQFEQKKIQNRKKNTHSRAREKKIDCIVLWRRRVGWLSCLLSLSPRRVDFSFVSSVCVK